MVSCELNVESLGRAPQWPLHLDLCRTFVQELDVSLLPFTGPWRVFWSWVVSSPAYQIFSLYHLIWPSIEVGGGISCTSDIMVMPPWLGPIELTFLNQVSYLAYTTMLPSYGIMQSHFLRSGYSGYTAMNWSFRSRWWHFPHAACNGDATMYFNVCN
jgi:hypothetical protein